MPRPPAARPARAVAPRPRVVGAAAPPQRGALRAALWALCALLALAALPAPPAAARAAAPRVRDFAATGQTVAGRFLDVWEEGGLDVYGLPLTGVFPFPSTDGRVYRVQYFERAVFEEHPEQAAPYDVLLTRLGAERAQARSAEEPFRPRGAPAAGARWFPETGHGLAAPFRAWWEGRGALAAFGYPLSAPFAEVSAADGRTYTVQYFERARAEYHPEHAGTPYEIELGHLGRERLDAAGVPASARRPGVRPTGATTAAGLPILAGPAGALGIQAQLYGQPVARLLTLTDDLGAGWVKQQVLWRDIAPAPGVLQWGELDAIVDTAARRGTRLILSVAKGPSWARAGGGEGFPDDPARFAAFLGALAGRYRGRVAAYELWNEANLAGETGGPVDVGRYAALACAGYRGLKAADPDALAVLGAPSPTGIVDPAVAVDDLVFLEALYADRGGAIRDCYDVLGSHPYGMSNPPESLWSEGHPGPVPRYVNHDSFYFRRIEEQRAIMERHGEGHKQIWLTEWGWGSDYRPGGYDQFDTVTEELRADYEVRAVLLARARYPWLGVMVLWNLNWSVIDPPYTGPAHYAILNADYSPRPAFLALRLLPR